MEDGQRDQIKTKQNKTESKFFSIVLTLKIASAHVVKTSVAYESPSQDSSNLDDHFQ